VLPRSRQQRGARPFSPRSLTHSLPSLGLCGAVPEHGSWVLAFQRPSARSGRPRSLLTSARAGQKPLPSGWTRIRAGTCCARRNRAAESRWGRALARSCSAGPCFPLHAPALSTHSFPFACSGLGESGFYVGGGWLCALPSPRTPAEVAVGHSHVHAGGVQGAVPVDRQELHPADLLLLLGSLEVRLQHAQGNVPEVVHWKRA